MACIFEPPWLSKWKKGKLTDLDIMHMFSTDGEKMIDAFLIEKNKLGNKNVLNQSTGLLFETFLVLMGVMPHDELRKEFCDLLGVHSSSEVEWKATFPPKIQAAPRVVCLHGMGGTSALLRKQLAPLMLTASIRCEFIQALEHGSYCHRDPSGEVINPMAAVHSVAHAIKERVDTKGIVFEGMIGFSQGSVMSGLVVGGQQANAVPKFQMAPLRFVIAFCGSELDWRTNVPRCFEGMPIQTPTLAIFGMWDISKFGKTKQKDAFTSWFDKKNCIRVQHPGCHTCLPGNLRAINDLVDRIQGFINTSVSLEA